MQTSSENLKNQLAQKLQALLQDDKKLKIIVLVGFIGIALIFFSDMLSQDKKQTSEKTDTVSLSTDAYKNEIESELENILSKIQGVGRVSVMVTIEGTTEYVYAEEVKKSSDTGTSSSSTEFYNEIVIIEKNGEKEALVRKIVKPQINGVIVVCEGGDSAVTSEKVYKAVSAVLNIPLGRICVAKG